MALRFGSDRSTSKPLRITSRFGPSAAVMVTTTGASPAVNSTNAQAASSS